MISLHPELTFADSRAISEAGFRHTANQDITTVVRLPNGEEYTTIVAGPDRKCRITNIGSGLAQIAAAEGVKAKWSVVWDLDDDVTPGETFMIRGMTSRRSWQRWVEITADLGLTGRMHRQTTAVDVALNQ